MFSIKTRLLFLLLPITLLLLVGLGYVNYFKTTEMFTQSVEEHLHTIVKAKEVALVEYIESTEKIGSAIAATEVVQTYAELTNRKLSGNNQKTLETLERRVENLLYSHQEAHWGRYHHIFLINRSNRIVMSPNHGAREKGSASSLLNQNMLRNRWAMEAMQKGTTMVSDYSSSQASDNSTQILFFPVRDESNRVQAVIGFELQVSYQQQIVTEGFSFGKTGQIYMIDRKGVPIDHKRIRNRVPLTGEALAQAKLTGKAAARRMNAQSREVIGFYAKHRQYPWILAAEIETDEVFANLYGLQAILIAGLAGTLVVLALLLLNLANGIVKPMRELTSQVKRISRGEFNIDIPDTRRKDEVGKLIQAHQQLVFSLQIVSKKLRAAKALRKAS